MADGRHTDSVTESVKASKVGMMKAGVVHGVNVFSLSLPLSLSSLGGQAVGRHRAAKSATK